MLAGLDLFGLPFPEEFGGSGATPTELVIVAEQLGHASLDVAMCYSGRLIPTLGIYEWGTDEQRARLAPEIVSGHRNYAVAISEPDAGSDAAALRTTAEERGATSSSTGRRCGAPAPGSPTPPSSCTPPHPPALPQAPWAERAAHRPRRCRESPCDASPPWRATSSARTVGVPRRRACPRRTISSVPSTMVACHALEPRARAHPPERGVRRRGAVHTRHRRRVRQDPESSSDRPSAPSSRSRTRDRRPPDPTSNSSAVPAHLPCRLAARPGHAVPPGGGDGQAQGIRDLRPGGVLGTRSSPGTASQARA